MKYLLILIFFASCSRKNDSMNKFLSNKKIAEDSLKQLQNDHVALYEVTRVKDTSIAYKSIPALANNEVQQIYQERAIKEAEYSIDSLSKLK